MTSKIMSQERISASVPVEKKKRLELLADALGISMTEVLVKALEAYELQNTEVLKSHERTLELRKQTDA
jgi:hypothetical protein